MESLNRYVNFAYLVLGVVAAWFCVRTFGMVLDWMGPRADRLLFADIQLSVAAGVLAGAGIAFALYKNEKTFAWTNEVAVELSKVTWPDQEDTQRSTYVVIVFSVMIALVLAGFDFVWKAITDLLL